MSSELRAFYDGLAPDYHLIFADWDASVARQGEALAGLIRSRWPRARTVLDLACGIGTQALGLAARGFALTASDISAGAVARAREEAAVRSLELELSVADMREAWEHHRCSFDVVMACDNAVPHLESEAELERAFAQMYRCTAAGGACILSVRDYEAVLADGEGTRVLPYGVRDEPGRRVVPLQVWRFEPPVRGQVRRYELALYLIEDRGAKGCETAVFRCHYHAYPIARLCELLREAGFASAERVDGVLYQPLILAQRASRPSGC